MTRQSIVSHRIQHIHKFEITAIIAGIVWMLFAGTILLTAYRNDDLLIIKGYFDLRDILVWSEISIYVSVLMGLSLLLSPINRKFFGVVATVLACSMIGFSVYFYLKHTDLQSSFSFIFTVFFCFSVPCAAAPCSGHRIRTIPHRTGRLIACNNDKGSNLP